MEEEKDQLLLIEKLRAEMVAAGMMEGWASERTLSLSQRLDGHIANFLKNKEKQQTFLTKAPIIPL
ncbi:Spo0E family sporulation regulatory protein-aspartic acid phosphatase [Neobacillus sp. SM06]|uniref:Spo0E family sporulation regulatory protein-aspartic acid phosphatase n=1 Tax=Neobacillus sp. SM06 TaxID=3422492 RepID=UPI003D2E949B